MSDAGYRRNTADQDIVLDAETVATGVGTVHRLRVSSVGAAASAQAKRYDEVSATVSYLGIADAGTATSAASWQIQRITFGASDQDVTIEFADGDVSYDNVWDNRASLSYS